MKLEKALAKLASAKALANKLTPPDFSGDWKNQYGSTMALTITGDAISGTYTSKVSSTGATVSGPLTGFVNGDILSFCVRWQNGAITSWVGQLVEKNKVEVITTLWQMVVNIPDSDEPTGLWTTVYAGTDDFSRP